MPFAKYLDIVKYANNSVIQEVHTDSINEHNEKPMIVLSNAVPDPRTMVVILLNSPYLDTPITIRTVSGLGRLFSFTKGTNELSLVGLVQEQHGFFAVVLKKPWVTVADHHERNSTEQENEQRDYLERNI